ncbi:MAG: TetR/AcrR family transcriptional regulator [Acidimicrobiales bacterium]
MVQRSIERSLAARQATARDEVERLLAAARKVMGATGLIDPKVSDIVRESGLSNQAFYRHFRGRDELLLALLDDGLTRLVGYLEHLMAKEPEPIPAARRWVEGILAQAARPVAAAATRPFVLHRLRLADLFPEESRQSEQRLRAPLQRALAEAAGRASPNGPGLNPARDSAAIFHLAMGHMQEWVLHRHVPTRAETQHVTTFAIAGLTRGGASGT